MFKFTGITKTADINFHSPGPDAGGKLVAGGLFIGYGDRKTHQAKYKQTAEWLNKSMKKHKSLKKTREAYVKKFPKHYTTLAFKFEGAPKAPSKGLFKWRTLTKKYKANVKKHESAKKSYTDRVKNPRPFFRVDAAGGFGQQAFYKEIQRGYHDKELNQIHIPKKDKVIYV